MSSRSAWCVTPQAPGCWHEIGDESYTEGARAARRADLETTPMINALPALRLRGRGIPTVTLRPGEELSIGRHATNGLVLTCPSVSRLHARITWAPGAASPVVHDLVSVNGTCVDGRPAHAPTTLRDGGVLSLGDVTLRLELDAAVDPSIIDDDGPLTCRLIDEVGPQASGVVSSRGALTDLLLELEARRRTGTLLLDRARRRGRVTFARGRVVDVVTEARSGPPALRELLETMTGARYTFRVDVEPHECPMSISIRAWLEAEDDLGGRAWARLLSA